MAKISNKYLEVDPYKIEELGFHKDRNQVSESLFSLSNEYQGIRGFAEESTIEPSLEGVYFNGIYEYAKEDTPNAYKGIVKRTHFTINSVNWVKVRIYINDDLFNFNDAIISNFKRSLDFKTGEYIRQYDALWNGFNLNLAFYRHLNMINPYEGAQRIKIKSDKECSVRIEFIMDSNVLHWGSDCYWNGLSEIVGEDYQGLEVETISTNQKLVSLMKVCGNGNISSVYSSDMKVTTLYSFELNKSEEHVVDRLVVSIIDKTGLKEISKMEEEAYNYIALLNQKGYDGSLKENIEFYKNVWDKEDIEIVGNDLDQQGIRFCIFQLTQTYHGYDKDNNIGAKGLTGEAYSGHAFWDSETYCLPYYLFNNRMAALNLLMFRYNTLDEAKKRAIDLDLTGACYPIATRNGKEGCNLWQHASCQMQPSTAVSFAIYHYMNLYNDKEFMQNYGLEMLLEISKYLLSRGDYNPDRTRFGYYGVMGPDEFQLFVNHNTYTNYMAKRTFDYLFEVIDSNEYKLDDLYKKCSITNELINEMREASNKMMILYDLNTHLFEQHRGFYELPHIDVDKIPTKDFPLYHNWSYDRIYRNDMIKQPDVLMFMFLYNSSFSFEDKKANYEYYEPKCIHESSLSPSIHSIFAAELGKMEEAENFFSFATRLDLDDYNCNTREGIHTTSIAAAWMNIVYGFGGLRSDSKVLKLNPTIPSKWQSYSFYFTYKESVIKVTVNKENIKFNVSGKPQEMEIYSKLVNVTDGLVIER